jgi:hypothetical protein
MILRTQAARRVVVFIFNGDPAAAEGDASRHEEAARRSLEYAATTLRSFEEHHTRLAAKIAAHVVEVAPGGVPPQTVIERLKQRFAHACETVVIDHATLRPFLAGDSPDHLQGFLHVHAIRTSPERNVALLGEGLIFVRDGAATEIFDAVDATEHVAAAFQLPSNAGDPGRDLLHPGAIFVDAERIRGDPWLSSFTSVARVESRASPSAEGGSDEPPSPAVAAERRTFVARSAPPEPSSSRSATPEPPLGEAQARRECVAREQPAGIAAALCAGLLSTGRPGGLLPLSRLFPRAATDPRGVVASEGIVICPFLVPGAEQALEDVARSSRLGAWPARALRKYRSA